MSYKKRDKGGWNQGKAYKGTRKAVEREWVKKEIEAQQSDTVKYKSKRKRNRRMSLENQLAKYTKLLEEVKQKEGHHFGKRFYRWMIADAKKGLAKLDAKSGKVGKSHQC